MPCSAVLRLAPGRSGAATAALWAVRKSRAHGRVAGGAVPKDRLNFLDTARTMAASVQQRIAFGERAGQTVRRIGAGFGHASETPTLTGPRCASVRGFSLHANTQVPAHRRDQLERLIRYTARGAVSLERLAQDTNGDLVYSFTHPWSDGTTGIRLSPLELLEKLVALVPLPRVHLVRYGGCLAPPQQLAQCDHPHATPARRGRGEDGHRVAAMELGTAVEARLCRRHSTLPIVSGGVATDH